ncbi:MAG TPA: ATP-binding cassette domain-containing protein [Candidatus Micrarchaeaceae archaeon]|nr:ATP-binding cassette domain-containing protein [Candidatus Micrarchaeaceae archaeon]
MPVTRSSSDYAVRTTALRKAFRANKQQIEALKGLDLEVTRGQIFGFLGPNGAGKTTALRILTTLLPADAGEAFVAGADVRRRPQDVRRRIGYVGQIGGADLSATGRENLSLQGRLYGMTSAETARRVNELAESLDLKAFSDRIVRTYSGGQRRRLEVALGIMHRPEVLFLDEPTTGLDPQNRNNLWDQLRLLRETGTTICLTTHYLEEADQLSDRLAIIDHGRIIAEGTPHELKQRFAASTIRLVPKPGAVSLEQLGREFAHETFVSGLQVKDGSVQLRVTDTTEALAAIFGRLRNLGIELRTVSLTEPSLDDVFLQETGRSLRDSGEPVAKEAA